MSITSLKNIHCNVRSIKPLTCKSNTVINPFCRIIGTRLQDLVQDRFLLRVYNGWSLSDLFFLEENPSAGTPTLVNYVQNIYPEIIFNIMTRSISLKSVKVPYLITFGSQDKNLYQSADNITRDYLKVIETKHDERIYPGLNLGLVDKQTKNNTLDKIPELTTQYRIRVKHINNLRKRNLPAEYKPRDAVSEINGHLYEVKEGRAPLTLTPLSLPVAGMEEKETAFGSVRSIFRPSFQGSGTRLVEKLVRNVFKTFKETRLERYPVDKERFERTIGRYPFFNQEERDTTENVLIQNYSSFKSELAYIENPIKSKAPRIVGSDGPLVLKIIESGMRNLPAQKRLESGMNTLSAPKRPESGMNTLSAPKRPESGIDTLSAPKRPELGMDTLPAQKRLESGMNTLSAPKRPESGMDTLSVQKRAEPGMDTLYVLKRPESGLEYLSDIKVSSSLNFWRTAEKVFSRTMSRKQILEIHKRRYSGILEPENETQLQRKQRALTNNANQEAIIKGRIIKQSVLKILQTKLQILQTKDHYPFTLSGKINSQDKKAGTLEFIIPSLPTEEQSDPTSFAEKYYYRDGEPWLNPPSEAFTTEVEIGTPTYRSGSLGIDESIDPSKLTPLRLPSLGMEDKETALGSVRSIFRSTFQGSGTRLVEKLVRNVFKTFKETRLERYLVDKERFERTIGKYPFFNQGERDTTKNVLIQNYSSFKSELAYIENPIKSEAPRIIGADGPLVLKIIESGIGNLLAPKRLESGMDTLSVQKRPESGIGTLSAPKRPELGMDTLYVLKRSESGLEYLSDINVPSSLNFWRTAEKVFSRTMSRKQTLEIQKRRYSGILEPENETQLQRKQRALTNNANQEAIIKGRIIKQSVLKILQTELRILQTKDHYPFTLSGKINSQDKKAGTLEFIIPSLPSEAQEYSLGSEKYRPPSAHKGGEQISAKPLQQRESASKSLNASKSPTDFQTGTIYGKIMSENRAESSSSLAGESPYAEMSELLQLKPNIGASITIVDRGEYRRSPTSQEEYFAEKSDSTSFAEKYYYRDGELRRNPPSEAFATEVEIGTPTYRSGSLGIDESIEPSKLTPLRLPALGMEDKETALGSVRSIFRPTFQGSGTRLVEKLVQNAFKAFKETRLERYLVDKERFERTIGRYPFFNQGERDTTKNVLIQNYSSFKSELAYIENPIKSKAPRIVGADGPPVPKIIESGIGNLLAQKRLESGMNTLSIQKRPESGTDTLSGPKRPEPGMDTLYVLKRPESGLEYLSDLKVPSSLNFWRTAEKVFSRTMSRKQIPKIHKRGYSGILELENETQLRRKQRARTNNTNQEAIIKGRIIKQSLLKILQTKDHYPFELPSVGLNYKETAPERVKSVFGQTFQSPRGKLVEKLVQNVFRTIIENRLERYLGAKERFEKVIGKNSFFKQAEKDTQEDGLIQSYSSFKSELAYIENPFKSKISKNVGEDSPSVLKIIESGMEALSTLKVPESGMENLSDLKRPESGMEVLSTLNIPTAGMEYLPALKIPDGLIFWRIAEKVFSGIKQTKQILEVNKKGYSRILEREKEAQPRRTQSVLTHIDNQESIIKRRETKLSGLKLLQNKDHFVLSGKINYQNSKADELEFIVPTLPSITTDYSSGYNKNMPPITYKSGEQVSAKQPQQRELVVKSLNTPTEPQIKTIKKSVDLDLNPTQLSNLVDKVYAQLESKLAWERRRYGY